MPRDQPALCFPAFGLQDNFQRISSNKKFNYMEFGKLSCSTFARKKFVEVSEENVKISKDFSPLRAISSQILFISQLPPAGLSYNVVISLLLSHTRSDSSR